ncbi:MAG: cysteine synthase family protein [Clostridiales Family XIII bacterium]|jgi:cysteine synthase A|nr:cysteine synthase family protein [Clostridiales Family XIII bacterium]
MKKTCETILECIGETPLLRLGRLKKDLGFDGDIYAKLDHLNPSFSKKDRIALGMVEAAERSGALKEGMPVIEMTSGNTGTGVALVCSAKGYRFICVMSVGNSVERVRMIRAFGGEVVLVDQAPGAVRGKVTGADLELVEQETERIVRETGGCFLNQFANAGNSLAQEQTAREIWGQSGGAVDAFADFVGTGGTFAGCAKGFKDIRQELHCYVVEPKGYAYYGGEVGAGGPGHRIQGGGYAKEMPLITPGLIDGCVSVSDEEAMGMTRALARVEGVFAGFSSGANIAAAVRLLKGQEKGRGIAVVINDCGLKYMSTDLY